MGGERCAELRRLVRVAEDTVVDAGVKGREHLGRGHEVHVGHPHWQQVTARIAVPLLGARAVPVGAGGEQRIEWVGHAASVPIDRTRQLGGDPGWHPVRSE